MIQPRGVTLIRVFFFLILCLFCAYKILEHWENVEKKVFLKNQGYNNFSIGQPTSNTFGQQKKNMNTVHTIVTYGNNLNHPFLKIEKSFVLRNRQRLISKPKAENVHSLKTEIAPLNIFNIYGYIIDKLTDEPLTDVRVSFKKNGKIFTSFTDRYGKFSLYGASRITYSLSAFKTNYDSTFFEVNYSGKTQNQYKIIKMMPSIISLPPVVINATRINDDFIGNYDGLAENIKPLFIRHNPSGINDLFRSISQLPSASLVNDLNALLYIRGGSPDQNLIELDGIEINYPYRLRLMMGGGLSAFIPGMINNAEIIPGGFSANFGNKMSSVIQLKSINGSHERPSFKTKLDFLTFDSIFECPITKKGSFIVAGRRSIFDLFAGNILKGKFVLPRFFDFHTIFTYNFSPKHILKINFLRAMERISHVNLKTEEMNVTNKIDNSIIGIVFKSILTKRLLSRFSLSLNSDKNNLGFFDSNSFFYDAKLHYDLQQINFKGNLNYVFTPNVQIELGTDIRHNISFLKWNSHWRSSISFPIQIDFAYNTYLYSNYLQIAVFNSKPLHFSFGIRQDYNTMNKKLLFSPRFSFQYRLNNALNLYGAFGDYFQYPNMMMFLSRGEPLDFSQNISKLKAEKSKHFIIGFKMRFKNFITCKADGYYKKYSDLLLPINFNSFYAANIGKGISKGVEITIKKELTPFSPFGVSINYSRSVAKYRHPSYSKFIPFDWDHPHAFSASFKFRFRKRLYCGLSWNYRSGLPYTPYTPSLKNRLQKIAIGRINSLRYPAFSRFDVKIEYYLKFGKNLNSIIHFDLLNFTNNQNIYAYQWNSSTSHSDEKNPIYMMPFMVSIGLQIDI